MFCANDSTPPSRTPPGVLFRRQRHLYRKGGGRRIRTAPGWLQCPPDLKFRALSAQTSRLKIPRFGHAENTRHERAPGRFGLGSKAGGVASSSVPRRLQARRGIQAAVGSVRFRRARGPWAVSVSGGASWKRERPLKGPARRPAYLRPNCNRTTPFQADPGTPARISYHWHTFDADPAYEFENRLSRQISN